MLSQRTVETGVGIFVLAAIAAFLVLAFKVSGLTSLFHQEGYTITAIFDEIGQLKPRATVKIGGVTIGQVENIKLDPKSFKAIVNIRINNKFRDIPSDSEASILTAGLLGDNYIAITPMYSNQFLQNGSEIQETHSAMILERLIGQLIFKISNSDNQNKSTAEHETKGVSP